MPRYKLTLEYDGTPYHGWQRQPGLPTVQGALEDAIQKFCGVAVTLEVAGRTDKGVHATGMVCHADLPNALPGWRVADALNALTPRTITVLKAQRVPTTFQARFGCVGRHYQYLICNRRAFPALLTTAAAPRAAHIRPPLDILKMRQAAALLCGRHDFSSFRSRECQAKSPVTALHSIRLSKRGEVITITLHGAAFLHHMVRLMVGLLVDIGSGKRPVAAAAAVLAARDVTTCSPMVPAHGLYFTRADYAARPTPGKTTK